MAHLTIFNSLLAQIFLEAKLYLANKIDNLKV